jgi:hypothetical protein
MYTGVSGSGPVEKHAPDFRLSLSTAKASYSKSDWDNIVVNVDEMTCPRKSPPFEAGVLS